MFRFLKWALLPAFVVFSIAVIMCFDLQRESSQVVSTTNWLAGRYAWVSSNEVFYVRKTSNGQYEPSVIHLGTKQTRHLLQLDPYFRPSAEHAWSLDWDLSPNGEWLLLWEPGAPTRLVVRLDGTKSKSWTGESSLERPFWIADSRALFELGDWNSSAKDGETLQWCSIYSIEQGGIRKVPFIWGMHGIVLGMARNGAVIMTSKEESNGVLGSSLHSGWSLERFPKQEDEEEAPHIELPEDENRRLYDVTIDPVDNRCICHFIVQSRIPQFITTQSFPYVQTREKFYSEFWVCQMDVRGLRRIAQTGDGEWHDFRWVPGGRQISFIANGTLHLFSVD